MLLIITLPKAAFVFRKKLSKWVYIWLHKGLPYLFERHGKMLIGLKVDFSVLQSYMSWMNHCFLKSLGKVPSVKQWLMFLFKKSILRPGNCFFIFVGISLSSLFISPEISSEMTSCEREGNFLVETWYHF